MKRKINYIDYYIQKYIILFKKSELNFAIAFIHKNT